MKFIHVKNSNFISLKKTFRLFVKIVLPHVLKYKKKLLTCGFLMLFLVILQLPIPLLTKHIIDVVLPTKDFLLLLVIVGCMASISVLNLLVNVINSYLSSFIQEYTVRDIQVYLLDHVLKLPLKYFNSKTSGRISSYVTSDVNLLVSLFGNNIVSLTLDLLVLIIGIIILFFLHVKLTILTLLLLPLFLFSLFIFKKPIQKEVNELQNNLGFTSGILIDALEGILLVKAYILHQKKINDYRESLNETKKASIKYTTISIIANSFTALIGSFVPVIVFLYGGYEIINDHMTLGTLIAFNSYLSYIFVPTQRLFNMHVLLQSSAVALNRIDKLLSEETEYSILKSIKPKYQEKCSVEFSKINFSYNGKTPIFEQLSLNVFPGEHVAIIGRSGVGKTTLMNLLLKFYSPDSGEIKINGINIKDVNVNNIRKLITIIPQDTFLFNGTILDNIKCGLSNVTNDEIVRVSKCANIHKLIMSLPKKYETEIGPRGTKLSGGEKQRVAIARALLRNPSILILDESFSEIDSISECDIQSSLNELLKNRTTFIISHKLINIIDVDRIILIDNGKVEAEGTHKNLLDTNAKYRHIYELQK